MDEVFRALADPTRRGLLDALHERDGQTLTELERNLNMTRFGVMKHLRILEDAGLVVSRKAGRARHHHLNAVPIQLVQERWVSKYAEPWARALTGLKSRLEDEAASTAEAAATEDPVASRAAPQVFEVYIRATPARLWQALTDPAFTRRYWTGGWPVSSVWTPGSRYVFTREDGEVGLDGENLEVDAPRRLVQTFHGRWDELVERDGPSTVTWDIEPRGEACRLRLVHERLGLAVAPGVGQTWVRILSGLKTLLETGEPLPIG